MLSTPVPQRLDIWGVKQNTQHLQRLNFSICKVDTLISPSQGSYGNLLRSQCKTLSAEPDT